MSSGDRQKLIDRISSLAEKATDTADLALYNPGSAQYRSRRLQRFDGVSMNEVEALSRDLADYFDLELDANLGVRTSPSGGGGFNPRYMGYRFIARARITGAEETLEAFERFFAIRNRHLLGVAALWGLHPLRSFEIWNGIWLRPLHEVPSSEAVDVLMGVPSWAGETGSPTMFEIHARPRAALTWNFTLEPALIFGPRFPPLPPESNRELEVLDIARCLTVVCSRQVSHLATWYQTDYLADVLPEFVAGGGQLISWGHQFAIEPEAVDEELASEVIRGFFRLDEKVRQRLRVVMDRLNAAKIEAATPESRAIDLGIALEALLFNPKDPSSEISSKFKLRGALLASDVPEERKKVSKLLDNVYRLRSIAAHGGSFQEDDPAVYEALLLGTELACTLLVRVLRIGRIPENWNGLILGWDRIGD